MDHNKIAAALLNAEKMAKQIPTISDEYPDMTVDDAYAIQLKNIETKLKEGETLIGYKIGLTSKGMQNLLKVNEPDYGHLTDKMLLLEGESCPRAALNQPKVEGELAFCFKNSLKGPGVTLADVYNSTSFVVPAIEIVDSRVKDWKIKLVDTIADNGSSARFVLGNRMTPIEKIDMRLIGMIMEKNGELVNSGTGAEVLGNPAASVVWLINKLSEHGISINAGDVVLSGAFTAAEAAEAGDSFTVSFHGLGSVSIKFI